MTMHCLVMCLFSCCNDDKEILTECGVNWLSQLGYFSIPPGDDERISHLARTGDSNQC